MPRSLTRCMLGVRTPSAALSLLRTLATFMDKLQAISTFVRAVDARSFSKAAETLSMPRSSVTTTIKNLEQHLGTVLLRRSTRNLSLTEAGERYYASCRTILAEIDRAEKRASRRHTRAARQGESRYARRDRPGRRAAESA